jgi:hypothetical protein
MMGEIKKGDQIEAKVNDPNHALSIRKAQYNLRAFCTESAVLSVEREPFQSDCTSPAADASASAGAVDVQRTGVEECWIRPRHDVTSVVPLARPIQPQVRLARVVSQAAGTCPATRRSFLTHYSIR